MGDGTSDQFQHYLYNQYAAKVVGDSGNRCVWISDGSGDNDLCFCETYFLKKVRRKMAKRRKPGMLLASSVIPNGYEVLYGSQDKIFQRLQTKVWKKIKAI